MRTLHGILTILSVSLIPWGNLYADDWPSPVCFHQASLTRTNWMEATLANDARISGAVNFRGTVEAGGIRLKPGRDGYAFIDFFIRPGSSSVEVRFGDERFSEPFLSKRRYIIDIRILQGLLILEVDGRRVFEGVTIPIAPRGVNVAFTARFKPDTTGVVCFEAWQHAREPPTKAPVRYIE